MQRNRQAPAVSLDLPGRRWIGLLFAVILLVFFWNEREREASTVATSGNSESAGHPLQTPKRPAPRLRKHAPRTPDDAQASSVLRAPRSEPIPPTDCLSEFELHCFEGDPWWVDSCGERTHQAEECGATLCQDGGCAQNPPCERESETGTCVEGRVRTCLGGQVIEVDCSAHGEHCVQSPAYGAICRKQEEDKCEEGLSWCTGNQLSVCVTGNVHEVDCAEYDAQCESDSDQTARCVRITTRLNAPERDDPCEPCGCPETASEQHSAERCDGLDNNGNGKIDEGLYCSPVDIVAFLVAGSTGQSSYTRADVEDEIDRINALFGEPDSDTSLRFQLGEVITLTRPLWLDMDDEDFQRAAAVADTHPIRPAFYIPLIFTDRVLMGRVPKAGVSSLPYDSCAVDSALSPHALAGLGAVVVSKGRHFTTAAHEIGHFLGLCHTHATSSLPWLDRVEWPGDSFECEACGVLDDGICDTPTDPGQQHCVLDPTTCATHCQTEAAPDTLNIMSYYHACRYRFSDQQAIRMRKTLYYYRQRTLGTP